MFEYERCFKDKGDVAFSQKNSDLTSFYVSKFLRVQIWFLVKRNRINM